uniref:Uncharacterized protein n=1 Tax=Triticum urartu TaxID=4572 RepID=A0A8R7U822_TRIUA
MAPRVQDLAPPARTDSKGGRKGERRSEEEGGEGRRAGRKVVCSVKVAAPPLGREPTVVLNCGGMQRFGLVNYW